MNNEEHMCHNCENRCMDMDMDPYCCRFNEPWGLRLDQARQKCLVDGKLSLWQQDRRGKQ